MEWKQLEDIIISFIGSFILLISIITIPEIRSKKKYWITATALIIALAWFGYDKINRDAKKSKEYLISDTLKTKKIDSLVKKVSSLNDTISFNHINDMKFQKRLDSMFHIIRDSTNYPVKTQTFNTNFEKARDVYIGSN